MHSTCAYAKTCKSYHSKCKYMHGLFCYLCHLDMTLRITLIETTTLGTTFLTESLMWVFFFFKKFGNKKRNCFTVYICVVLTTWYNSIYCVPFTGFALFVSFFMCTYFLSHHPPLQISSSFKEVGGDLYETIPPPQAWTFDTPIGGCLRRICSLQFVGRVVSLGVDLRFQSLPCSLYTLFPAYGLRRDLPVTPCCCVFALKSWTLILWNHNPN